MSTGNADLADDEKIPDLSSDSSTSRDETVSTEKVAAAVVADEAAPPPADPDVVDWDGPDDPKNPQNWSSLHKWTLIGLVSTITFITSLASTIFAPAVPSVMDDFDNNNAELKSFVISVYIIGFCVGPLVLSPLSELYGRSPVMHSSNIFFLIFTIACAVSTNVEMFIVFRLFMGLAGCPPLTLGGGTIADLMPQEKRGKALSIWTMGPLLGPVVGPIVGGYLAQGAGWRWIFWLVAILTGLLTLLSFVFLRETYGPTLLAQKAARLRKETGNANLRSKFEQAGRTPGSLFKQAVIRPTKMLCFSPIVFILALDVSIVYSYLYFIFTTFTYVYQERYGFDTGQAGLAYLGLGIGFVVGQFAVGAFSDRWLKHKSKSGPMKPEYRLPPLIIGAFLIPAGFLWYGWAAEKNAHWIVPIIGTSVIGLGTLFSFLPIQVYLVDAFTIYAASAIATNTVVRSLFGATLPLASQKLFANLGLGWGNTLLAGVALLLSPTPFILMKYGERIRTSPRFQVKL